MGRYENYPLLAKNIKKAGQLKCLYNKIKKLSDELFCTGDIQTIDDCLEVYRQYVNNESFDPFLYNDWEKKKVQICTNCNPLSNHNNLCLISPGILMIPSIFLYDCFQSETLLE